MDEMIFVERLKQLYNAMKIQLQDGNWNYDPYMLGYANGLILSFCIMAGGEPVFKDAPDKFLVDMEPNPQLPTVHIDFDP